MALKAEERQALVDYLTTNCDCWKDEAETLNGFKDELLTTLKEDEEKRKEALAANTTTKPKEPEPRTEPTTVNDLVADIKRLK